MSGYVRALLACDGSGPHEPASGYIVASSGDASVMLLREHAVKDRGWSTAIPPSGYPRDLCPKCTAERSGRAGKP